MNLPERLALVFYSDYSQFEKVTNPRAPAPDLHAMMLLTEVVGLEPGQRAIACAEHDIVYLNFNVAEANKKLTDEQVVELARCGLCCDLDGMFFHC